MIGLIVLLAALLYPIVQIVRYRSYEIKCRANLWNIMLKYEDFKSQGYKGQELRRQVMYFVEDHPEVGRCPLTGREYTVLTILNQHRILTKYTQHRIPPGDIWVDNPEVIVSCSCHVDPKKRYKMEGCLRKLLRLDQEEPDTWYLSGVDRGGQLSVEYAPDIVARVQHRSGGAER